MNSTYVLAATIAATLALASAPLHADSVQGPGSSATPYVVPTADGWDVVSLLTVGDTPSGNGYPLVGIPDGLGAVVGRVREEDGIYVPDPRYMTVFMNHELGSAAGVPRAHGSAGAFVSQWTVHLNSFDVAQGQDLIEQVFTYQNGGYVEGTTAFSRMCSADLPGFAAFFNLRTLKGYPHLIFMNGEEAGNEGRAFAHIASGPEKGTTYELPWLGKFSWENAVAHANAGDRTLVVGTDDSTPGQVYLYVGDKQRRGNPIERAGLAGGRLLGIKVTNGGANYANGAAPLENAGAIDGTFTLVDLTDVALGSGANLDAQSDLRGVTRFARPEDGAWDTKNPRVFYFAVTGATVGGVAQSSKLYRLTLDSLSNPTGGRIDLIVDATTLVGTDGQAARSFDNLTVDGAGQVVVQEDPGNNAYIAKTWRIDPVAGTAVQVLESDRARFSFDAPNGLTDDEENSGVIDVTNIVRFARWYERGRRYYLADLQAHYPNGTELVEGGQLYLFASPQARRDD